MQTEIKTAKVLIGIQARSNSTRFPQKIFEMLGKKMILQHVIDQANSAKMHIERSSKKANIKCEVAVLHPYNDVQIKTTFKNSSARLIEGDEQDLISRYLLALNITGSDYVVRITSDCPLIMDYVISKHINVAVLNDLDYVSNVEESCRVAADGFDCEIISRKALEWLDKNSLQSEREHVTPAIRRVRPQDLRQGFISFKLDTSNLKLSLDTKEDLEEIRKYYHNREHKMSLAIKAFGRKGVYEL